MKETIKCSCGKKDVATPKPGQRLDEYLSLKTCTNCHNTGIWRVLSEDEARMD